MTAGWTSPDTMTAGVGGESGFSYTGSFAGRGGATKRLALKEGGGNEATERAVARGLAWLAKKQLANGSWKFDGTGKDSEVIAATGMCVLPFLAAGQTHKGGKYREVVDKGIRFLLANQQKDGNFRGAPTMYGHAIAAMALCECYGMTEDKGLLQYPCQRAINYVVKAQASDGSWGYRAGNPGDTSIVGWQLQALKSAEMCPGLTIDKNSVVKARKFLDAVGKGSSQYKSQYGYKEPDTARPTLTSVGLLCRYYHDGWDRLNPGMAEGVNHLLKVWPASDAARFDMYYYYYATQVVHFYEGDEWHKTWNPAMRDILVKKQVAGEGPNGGSWDADRGSIGTNCGRLGTTALAVLTLEVYYRHLPLTKRGTGGQRELERVR
jgi:hypothetical protein